MLDPSLVEHEQNDDIMRQLDGMPGVLYDGDPARLVVLLPVDDDLHAARLAAEDVVAFIASHTGQQVRAAQAHRANLAELQDAVEEAERVLSLVAAMLDGISHPYQMDELLVELAIARQPELGQRLAAQLDRVRDGIALRQTLETLFACNLDREQTAKVLHVHRRTLTYRLNRVRELTGIDPRTSHGMQLLRAMFTASRLIGDTS